MLIAALLVLAVITVQEVAASLSELRAVADRELLALSGIALSEYPTPDRSLPDCGQDGFTIPVQLPDGKQLRMCKMPFYGSSSHLSQVFHGTLDGERVVVKFPPTPEEAKSGALKDELAFLENVQHPVFVRMIGKLGEGDVAALRKAHPESFEGPFEPLAAPGIILEFIPGETVFDTVFAGMKVGNMMTPGELFQGDKVLEHLKANEDIMVCTVKYRALAHAIGLSNLFANEDLHLKNIMVDSRYPKQANGCPVMRVIDMGKTRTFEDAKLGDMLFNAFFSGDHPALALYYPSDDSKNQEIGIFYKTLLDASGAQEQVLRQLTAAYIGEDSEFGKGATDVAKIFLEEKDQTKFQESFRPLMGFAASEAVAIQVKALYDPSFDPAQAKRKVWDTLQLFLPGKQVAAPVKAKTASENTETGDSRRLQSVTPSDGVSDKKSPKMSRTKKLAVVASVGGVLAVAAGAYFFMMRT